MQEIVADTINDLEFLKLQLTTEIDIIKSGINSLKELETVKKYIELNKKIDKTSNIIKSIELIKKVEELKNTYTEVKQYDEIPITIEYYEKKLEFLNNLTSVNNVIYSKEEEDKFLYSSKTALKNLIKLKKKEGLNTITTLEEFNNYINTVRKSLQTYKVYETDKVVDEILSFKVYENPRNYNIKNVTKLPSITFEYLNEHDNLTEREQEAFFGTEVYKDLGISKEKEKVKRIGARKNARYHSSNFN